MFDVAALCTDEQYEALINGTALIKDFVVVQPSGYGDPIPGSPGGF
jgi:hypothetical protein